MSLPAQQYLAMRAMLRGALSGNYPSAANPSEQDVLGFFAQLFIDSSGATASNTTAMASAARGVLSGNFSTIANPNDADVVAFWTQLSVDSSGATQLSAQRYLAFRAVLRDSFSINYPGAANPSDANILSYFSSYGSINFASLFTPGTVLQAVQSDLGVTSSGGIVSQWNDQSGNGWHYTQATVGKRPTLTTGLRGKPGILFDGVDDVMVSALNLPAPGTTPLWVSYIGRVVTYVVAARLLSDNTGSGASLYSPGSAGSPQINMFAGTAQVSPQIVPLNNWECSEAFFANGTDYFRRGDLAAYRNGSAGNSASTGRSIGAQGVGAGAYANFEVLAVISLSALPSAAQIAAYRAAAQSLYGLAVRIGAAPGIGAVATRQRQGLNQTSALPYAVHTFHYASVNISRIRVAWPNYFGTGETGTGGVLTAKAAIEYPLGVRIGQLVRTDPVTGVTSATATAPSGDDVMFDDCTLSTTIPAGAKFYINASLSGAAGVPCIASAGQLYVAGGDAIEQTATDKTMSGTVVDGGLSLGIFPSLIAGVTSKSVVVAGDSRVQGGVDVADATGNMGELERSFCPTVACINIAMGGDTANNFSGGGGSLYYTRARRLALAAYGTHVVGQWGINDLAAARTSAQVQTDLSLIRSSHWPTLPYYGVTIAPTSTGAWTLANGSDQTAASYTANRLAVNAALPGLGFTGIYDTVGPSKLAADATKWNADGTVNKYTVDGVHETAFANLQYNFAIPT